MISTAPVPLPPDSASGKRGVIAGKILVVDDEASICRFIEKALRVGGYEDIIFCGLGTPVPFLALSERPRLIIMDVMMPGGNGMRALRKLKEAPATRGIPVILTSGFSVPTFEETPRYQPDHVLAKPFTGEQLLRVVNRLMPACPAV